jgi:putative cardiolipin synthase
MVKHRSQRHMTINNALLVLSLLLCPGIGCSPTVDSSTTDKPESFAIRNPDGTRLGHAAAKMAAKRDGQSGFLLLDRGRDALSWRTILADAAEKTIDAQYFLWKDDDAGRIMMQRLLAAAERGVRVRVLIDDSMTESDPEYLAIFGAHPNVQLRLYKPFGPRQKSTVMRWIDYVADLKVLNRRMHNKLYVVDGSMAIVGGRNIGNEYFEYPGPFVFRSRDLLALGPIVESTGRAFDRYWNSDWTVPIEQVVPATPTLQAARRQWKLLDRFSKDPSHYPPGFDDAPNEPGNELALLEKGLLWGKARLLVDAIPLKNGQPQSHAELDRTGVTLGRVTGQASDEVLIQSAYLILLDGGFAAIKAACDRGVKVRLATNSMASNNHLTAFVGYRKQRLQLLETGAELYEMRPDAKSGQQLFTAQQLGKYKPIFGLHAKTMVFDRKISFVGSFNLDPRSVNLNTETGLLVESETLSDVIATSIENDIAAGNSWQVTMNGRQTEWVTKVNGVITTRTEIEPMTSEAQRAEADLLTIVPDKSEL